MSTTTDTKPLSDRAVELAALVSAAERAAATPPANDNAGLGWRVDDAAPYTDDARQSVRIASRVARAAAPIVAQLLPADLWRVGFALSPAAVRLRPETEWSRATLRRVRTLLAFARAVGLDAEGD